MGPRKYNRTSGIFDKICFKRLLCQKQPKLANIVTNHLPYESNGLQKNNGRVLNFARSFAPNVKKILLRLDNFTLKKNAIGKIRALLFEVD